MFGQDADLLSETIPVATRKEPSIFKRPAKKTAAEQLQYAGELLREGRKSAAQKQYGVLVHAWPISPEAFRAQLEYARLLMERGKYYKAFDEFQYLIENYAGSFDYNDVIDSQFRIANHIMTRRRFGLGIFPGFSSPERALPLFEKLVKNAPDGKNAPEAAFYIGLINEQTGLWEDAVRAYGIVQSRYSGSEYAATAAFRHGYCLYMMYRRTPRDEVMCRRALTALSGFLRDYAGDSNEEQARQYIEELKAKLTGMRYDIAVFYDRKARNPNAAIIAYNDFIRTFPSSPLAIDASRRVIELEGEVQKGHSVPAVDSDNGLGDRGAAGNPDLME